MHGGGVDNIFPHHTNEIAQSEADLGHKWCNYWFHNEHLNDESGKMSKSKGDISTVSSLIEKGYNPLSFRFMCLLSHYRRQLTFSYASLDGAQNAYLKLKNKVLSLKNEVVVNEDAYKFYNERFTSCLEDDLNTANAITLLYDLLKDEHLNGATKLSLINKWDEVLSLDLTKEKTHGLEEEYIKEMIKKRTEAKKNKDFALADSIREELLKQGIILKDTREGTIYEVK